MVDFISTFRQQNRRASREYSAVRFEEDYWFLRDLSSHFNCMLEVVFANTEYFSGSLTLGSCGEDGLVELLHL